MKESSRYRISVMKEGALIPSVAVVPADAEECSEENFGQLRELSQDSGAEYLIFSEGEGLRICFIQRALQIMSNSPLLGLVDKRTTPRTLVVKRKAIEVIGDQFRETQGDLLNSITAAVKKLRFFRCVELWQYAERSLSPAVEREKSREPSTEIIENIPTTFDTYGPQFVLEKVSAYDGGVVEAADLSDPAIAEVIELVINYLSNGRHRDARHIAERLVEYRPDIPDALMMKALAEIGLSEAADFSSLRSLSLRLQLRR